jgi:hypothetical protein
MLSGGAASADLNGSGAGAHDGDSLPASLLDAASPGPGAPGLSGSAAASPVPQFRDPKLRLSQSPSAQPGQAAYDYVLSQQHRAARDHSGAV